MNLAIVIDSSIATCSQQDQNGSGLEGTMGFTGVGHEALKVVERPKLELKSFVSSSLRQEPGLTPGPVWATIGDPFKNKVQQQQP